MTRLRPEWMHQQDIDLYPLAQTRLLNAHVTRGLSVRRGRGAKLTLPSCLACMLLTPLCPSLLISILVSSARSKVAHALSPAWSFEATSLLAFHPVTAMVPSAPPLATTPLDDPAFLALLSGTTAAHKPKTGSGGLHRCAGKSHIPHLHTAVLVASRKHPWRQGANRHARACRPPRTC